MLENQISEGQRQYLLVTYVVFLVGLFTAFLVTIAGLVMAYLKRNEYNNTIYESHITYLIRTFWIGLLFGVISFLTLIIGIGFILLLLTSVWYIVRMVKGFVNFWDKKPINNPETWLF